MQDLPYRHLLHWLHLALAVHLQISPSSGLLLMLIHLTLGLISQISAHCRFPGKNIDTETLGDRRAKEEIIKTQGEFSRFSGSLLVLGPLQCMPDQTGLLVHVHVYLL